MHIMTVKHYFVINKLKKTLHITTYDKLEKIKKVQYPKVKTSLGKAEIERQRYDSGGAESGGVCGGTCPFSRRLGSLYRYMTSPSGVLGGAPPANNFATVRA